MWTVKSWSREEWLSNRTAETIVYQPPYANVFIHCTWILGLVLGMFCIPNGLEYQGPWMPVKHGRPIQTLWWRKSWFLEGGHNNFRWDNWTALFYNWEQGNKTFVNWMWRSGQFKSYFTALPQRRAAVGDNTGTSKVPPVLGYSLVLDLYGVFEGSEFIVQCLFCISPFLRRGRKG